MTRTTNITINITIEIKGSVDIYITSYLNLFLTWNKGVAFGLLSVNESMLYNIVTFIIGLIIIIILIMMWKNDNVQRYFLALVAGGALGNFYDRIVYTAVPDFIDIHINNFHWFIFNVADIFISLGVILLIITELAFNKKNND